MDRSNNQEQTFELLAPAGSFDIFCAVIEAGADAVYVGGNRFGARAYAGNFSEEELLEALDYAHLRGKKVYLTVNTLLKNEELGQLYDYLLPYYERGLDAVLVQDFGVLSFIHRHFPLLPIHTSTQMTITGSQGVSFLQKYGVSRIVLPRELSLREMKQIHDQTGAELEAFVHGALCYCYSGQCLFSSMLGGRSGNRGRCAQPCRLPYEVLDDKHKLAKNSSYVLSMKDLCGLGDLKELCEAGVYSLKIEGRMKQASYAAGVVSFYRKYIDCFTSGEDRKFSVSDSDMKSVKSLGCRMDFTDGYYRKQNGRDMITFEKPGYEKTQPSLEQKITSRYVEHQTKLKAEGELFLNRGDLARYEVSSGGSRAAVTGPEVLEAKSKPLNLEDVKKRMAKSGDTSFEMERIQVHLEEGSFLPNGALNQMRREALEQLKTSLLAPCYRNREETKPPLQCQRTDYRQGKILNYSCRVSCLAEKREQLFEILSFEFVGNVYLELASYPEKTGLLQLKEDISAACEAGKRVFLALPRIFRKPAEDLIQKMDDLIFTTQVCGFLVRSYEEFSLVLERYPGYEIVTDHNLYTYNDSASEEFRRCGAVTCTIPLELNRREIASRNNENSEMVVYGYEPLMTSAQCVHANTKACDKTPGLCYLKDRYQAQFPVKNYCSCCYNVIFNSLPLTLFPALEELQRYHISDFRLDFTLEGSSQVREVLTVFGEFLEKKRSAYPDAWQNHYTNGHYKRGVE